MGVRTPIRKFYVPTSEKKQEPDELKCFYCSRRDHKGRQVMTCEDGSLQLAEAGGSQFFSRIQMRSQNFFGQILVLKKI